MAGCADPSQPLTSSTSRAVSPARALVSAHDIEVGVDHEAEGVGDLAEHLLVLASGHQGASEVAGTAQRGHNRRKLDGLRAGTHEDHDIARCGQDPLPRINPFGLHRATRRAAISCPTSQMNSLLVVR